MLVGVVVKVNVMVMEKVVYCNGGLNSYGSFEWLSGWFRGLMYLFEILLGYVILFMLGWCWCCSVCWCNISDVDCCGMISVVVFVF